MPVSLHINALGAQGDGIAELDGRKVFAPFALPGETVSAEVSGDKARVIGIEVASPERADPRCSHYGACGGCSLQHMSETTYLGFKRDMVVGALRSQGIDIEVEQTLAIPPASRRRAVFAAARQQGRIVVGFHGRRSHDLIAIRDCAVLTPALLALIPKLDRIAAIATPRKDALTLTAVDTLTGIDLALSGARRDISADERLKLVDLALSIGLARLTLNGELAVERTPPLLRAGAASLTPPPGGFLQACQSAEAMIIEHVRQSVSDARRVADLFSGAGTFSLPLAATASVHAVESDAAALAALAHAARRAPGLRPVTTETRDLFRRPLTAQDLAKFDAVVIDPPRAGAEAQSQELAKSKVKRIAMVSCSAASFARDVRILIDGGYRLARVTPIDQFLWSPHVEIAASLAR